jgi:hypothetical protein
MDDEASVMNASRFLADHISISASNLSMFVRSPPGRKKNWSTSWRGLFVHEDGWVIYAV